MSVQSLKVDGDMRVPIYSPSFKSEMDLGRLIRLAFDSPFIFLICEMENAPHTTGPLVVFSKTKA